MLKRPHALLLLSCLTVSTMMAETDKGFSTPFEFGASYIAEGLGVLSGGLKKGATYQGMANISLSFHTERAGWWKGGSFLVTGANTHGDTPSANLIGDFQVASNIEAGNLTYLHEFWFRQEFANWTLIAGLQDLNSEFVYTESGNLFFNSSFGTHSTIASNVPSPIFPLTSLGGQVQYTFSPKTTLKVAVFDGMPEDLDYNPHNISWHWNSNDGYLAFAEVSTANLLGFKSPGMYKLGSYYHNHTIGLIGSDPSAPNYGMYLAADQTIYETSSGKTVNSFMQFSLSPASKNNNNWYLGGGIHCKGPLLSRPDDEFGLAFAHANLQHELCGSETTLECTYKLKLCDQLFIQPDLQCILHPKNVTTSADHALVAMLRLGLEF